MFYTLCMGLKQTAIAKISRPVISGIVPRARLFKLLDSSLRRPVVWLSSPAGSGKTTLISSYLDSRKPPCIWYQCDEGDADLAAFFYYMGLAAKKAAPRYKTPLPLLTPEYLASVPTFTRRYFEELCSRLPLTLTLSRKGRGKLRSSPPLRGGDKGEGEFMIVLDNYQELPVGSAFHDMLANGLEVIPDGVHFIVVSRGGPPPALARLQANEKISVIGYDDLRFTVEESKELVHGRIPKLDNTGIHEIYEKTEGWAAGITLMLEKARLAGTGNESTAYIEYEGIFDYFAGEVFDRTEKEVQGFLLKTAFLPLLSVHLAEKLTGACNAGRILAALNRQHYFTQQLSGSGQGYQYHPLFKDFLLNRAKTAFSTEELAVIQGEAALLLEQSGQIEYAARLHSDAGDRHGLVRMVILNARELLRQGRNKTLEEWIAGIASEPADDNPWLLYWTGMCSLPVDMPRTRKYLEKAFESFKAKDDVSGIYLSWAGIVDTYAYGFDEWKRLDDWIAVFDEIRKAYPVLSSKEIDLIVSSRMLFSLTLRKTDQPQWVHGWLERVSTLLQENPSFAIEMDTVFSMSVYYLWTGEYRKNAVLFEKAEAEIRHHKPSPFAVIRLKLMKGIHYWVTAQYELALNTLSEGQEISDTSGVHAFDPLLWSFRTAAEMARGNMALAEKSLNNQMASLPSMANTLDVFFYHINSAWYAILGGNPSLAVENLETISAKVEKMGTPYYKALWNIGMAQAAFMLGHTKDATTHIRTAHRISLDMKSYVMEWYSLLISAWFLLKEGREKEGLQSLRGGLSLGKKHGYVHLEFYQPSVMQFLYAKALEEGIEPEYVKGLIRKLGLTPPSSIGGQGGVESWPYPVKIYTLGRFEIIKDDKPLVFAGKVQKKPLEMLMALIAFGGENVPEERLTDALWPDAAGDLAHKSFEMTLSRLRRLLGGEAFIKYSAGQLSINPLCCWVDSLALEHLFEKIREAPVGQAALLCEKAVGLYKGPFFPASGLQWAVSSRETLKNRLLRIIFTAGRHCEQAGQWESAAEYYLKGLSMDNLAEEFYQRLMLCYQQLDRRAEAVKAYKRCLGLFQSELGIEPSDKTKAIYSSILQKQ